MNLRSLQLLLDRDGYSISLLIYRQIRHQRTNEKQEQFTGCEVDREPDSFADCSNKSLSQDYRYRTCYSVALTDVGANYSINSTANTGTVTIIDNDLPSISVRVTDRNAAETKADKPTNYAQFTLSRTGTTTNVLTVNYSLDGNATNGTDYERLANTVTFAPGRDTVTLDIKPIDDNNFESTEIVTLKLTQSDNYSIENKTGTITITDNDNPRDRRDSYHLEDLVLKAENLDKLPNSSETELVDLREFGKFNLSVDTQTTSNSGYNNYIAFYAVEDAIGTLANGLKPGDAGYAEAAIKNAMLSSFKTEDKFDRQVTGGKILAPVVIANGTFEDFLKRNPQNKANSNIHAYFNYLGANTDGIDHFRLIDDNKFGVEDTYGGGDRDYNDLVFQMSVKN